MLYPPKRLSAIEMPSYLNVPALPYAAPMMLGAIVLLPGCVSQPGTVDYYKQANYQVSAKDYGFVRPAVDVVVKGGGQPSSHRSDDDLWNRVRSGMGMQAGGNARVESEIKRLRSNPRYLEQLSRRAQPYLHFIVGELERRGLPTELALLPEVESRYNPTARSHKAASGMWQFIPPTGRRYGLKQNAWYDGRNDILASTRAALDYLEKLHREFDGDWELALAGYNAGEGAVAAARKRNRARGGSVDYWSLDLPRETEHYVPKLLAVARVVSEPQRYGMRLPRISDTPRIELVDTDRQIDLTHAASLTGVRLADLRRLNPGLKKGKTLPSGPHRILVPAGSGQNLRLKLAEAGGNGRGTGQGEKGYRVRKGDSLGKIASRHKVSVTALKKANGLKSDRVTVGKVLVIPSASPRPQRTKLASSAKGFGHST